MKLCVFILHEGKKGSGRVLSLFAWFAGDISSVWKIFLGKYSCDGGLRNLDGTQQEKRKNLLASLSLSDNPKNVTKLDMPLFALYLPLIEQSSFPYATWRVVS
jgi:hypothetical protein